MIERTAFSLERYRLETVPLVDRALHAYTQFDHECPEH
jgi:hypothetical protein